MADFRELALPDHVTGRLFLHSMPGVKEPLADAWAEVKRLGIGRIIGLAPDEQIVEYSPEYFAAIVGETLACPLTRFPSPTSECPTTRRPFGGWHAKPPTPCAAARSCSCTASAGGAAAAPSPRQC
jgi:hypothetical protein